MRLLKIFWSEFNIETLDFWLNSKAAADDLVSKPKSGMFQIHYLMHLNFLHFYTYPCVELIR